MLQLNQGFPHERDSGSQLLSNSTFHDLIARLDGS
jgi:hypothetical protein